MLRLIKSQMSRTIALTAMLILPYSTISNETSPIDPPENLVLKDYVYSNMDIFKDEFKNRFGLELPDFTMEYRDVEQGALTAYDNFQNKLVVKHSSTEDYDDIIMKGKLMHEMTHAYVHDLIDNQELGEGWLKIHNLEQEIICEGLATATRLMVTGEEIHKYKIKQAMEVLIEDDFITRPSLKYHFGHQAVNPILDELGVKEGIDAIFKHRAFTWDDLRNLEAYQKEVIGSVKNKSK
ncbi:hypothetical protein GOV11_05000 [Candidatus Woesearchaeota archaeon]|nr:hypothetical protein [Candidatus Woesearchaeota archaeon]